MDSVINSFIKSPQKQTRREPPPIVVHYWCNESQVGSRTSPPPLMEKSAKLQTMSRFDAVAAVGSTWQRKGGRESILSLCPSSAPRQCIRSNGINNGKYQEPQPVKYSTRVISGMMGKRERGKRDVGRICALSARIALWRARLYWLDYSMLVYRGQLWLSTHIGNIRRRACRLTRLRRIWYESSEERTHKSVRECFRIIDQMS